jgi:Type II secretion system (T2SS), protein E, N-terminal domain
MGKLGQLLVARGWITVQQLTRALQNQGVVGGRLGTCLIEMDAVTEDNLLKALSEQLGVPAVNLDDLRGIPQEVLGLVPDKLARRCRAVPFRLEGSRLDLAMMDARNLACQDEIAFATGKRVKVHVAHELRILEALEKFYKEECPSRYSLLADRLNRARYFWERPEPKEESVTTLAAPFEDLLGGRRRETLAPPPPLPDFPAQADPLRRPRPANASGPVAAPPPRPAPPPPAAQRPQPPPPARPRPVAAPAPPPSQPSRPSQTAPAPAAEPAAPVAPKPRPSSVPLTAEERTALGVVPPAPPAPAPAAAAEKPAPASIEEAEKALAATEDREEVGRLVLSFLLRDHKRAALFQGGRDKVTAWQAQGEGIDPKLFQRYTVGFDQPSLFLNLRQGSGVYLGPLPPMPAHRELARCWGGELPRDCVMLPVRIKDRLVAVIYADGAKKVDLVLLQRLATAASAALGRAILLKKQGEAKS